MTQTNVAYKIKRPFGSTIVILSLLTMISSQVYLLYRLNDVSLFRLIMSLVIVLLLLVLLIVPVKTLLMKPKVIQFNDESITIYNREVQATDIDKIMIDGYFFSR